MENYLCFVLSNTVLPESCDGIQWEDHCKTALGHLAVSFQLFRSPPWAASDIPRALQLGNSSDLLREPDVTRFFSLISRAVVWMYFKLLTAFSKQSCYLGFLSFFSFFLDSPFLRTQTILCNRCPFVDKSVKNAEIS